VQTQAERVKGAIAGLGEPSLAAESAARLAMFAAVADRSERRRPALRRRHRNAARLVAVAAIVLLISVVGAVAAGVDDLFGGPPAPPAIQRSIGQANEVRVFASWASPRIVASKTHRLMRVSTDRGDLALWIAPTRDGDLCLALQHPGERELGAACLRGKGTGRIEYVADYPQQGYPAELRSIWGRVPDSTHSLVLTLADRTTRAVAVEHGFFVAQIGRGDPTLLVARDAAGHVVARQPVWWAKSVTAAQPQQFRQDGSPVVTLPNARQVVRVKTWAGQVTFSVARSVYGGSCNWVSLSRKTENFLCAPGFEPAVPLTFGLTLVGDYATRPVEVFYADLPPGRLSAVRFHFADGQSFLARPRGRLVLYAFPPLTGLPAHRPLSYDLLGPGGRVVTHVVFGHGNPGNFGAALDRNNEIEHWTRDHPGYQPLR
jgi:hypothetical protein